MYLFFRIDLKYALIDDELLRCQYIKLNIVFTSKSKLKFLKNFPNICKIIMKQ